LISQEKADDFAEYLGFNEYASLVLSWGNRDVYITCDGVGTKLYLADYFEKWDTIGIDLVAMSVNDLLCCGATPVAFMDYYAVQKLDLDKSKEIIKGIKKGCELAGCKLVGGETAQLQGMFARADSFDLAGFAVGNVTQRTRIHSKLQTPREGDYIVGIPSSGLHSNGFTFLHENLTGDYKPWMLEPTRIYTTEILSNLSKIKKCAHVTGGGIDRALNRLVPNHRWDLLKNPISPSMRSLQIDLQVKDAEMTANFNCGWGMLIVSDTLDLDIPDAEHIGNVT
jgi:phosphoribosylformylglycinamidine cyclo-ligase